jgi:hypothetical protein
VRFDANTAPGLTAVNWQAGALATSYFYKGSIEYDTAKHETSGPRGRQYAQLLWKSATKVGFGYAGAYVVARYCADAGTATTPVAEFPKPPAKNISAFALNVCPATGCPVCPLPIVGLGYNNCYNTRALKYTNDLRKSLGYPALALDKDTARKAQSWATTFNNRGSGASSDQTRPEDCAALHFHQTVAAKIGTLATSGDAIMDWWRGSSDYDPTTGLPKGSSTDSKTRSDNYTRLVWKGATKVGFGVEGSWVVAWVCGVPANPTKTVT